MTAHGPVSLTGSPPQGRRLAVRAFVFMGLAYGGTAVVLLVLGETFKGALIGITTRFTSFLLSALRVEHGLRGKFLTTPFGSVEIIYECTGIFPLVLVSAAMVAFPCPPARKLLGVAVASAFILVLNQVRIVSLIYLNHLAPDMLPTVHLVVWPCVIVFSSAVLFVAWARSALDGR